ncbi:MAG: hypothetical protein ACHQ6U_10405 [Thermodesulfobacteriota bacterium]
MSKVLIYRSIFVSLVITLLYSTFGTQNAYSQCNVLCIHERGNPSIENKGSSVSDESGLSLEPSYEVAINDSHYTKAEGDDNSNLLAANDTGAGTYFHPTSNQWHFAIIPYLWAAATSGKVGIGPVTADISQSFSDTLSNLDGGFAAHIEAWTDKFGFFFDGNYSSYSAGNSKTAQLGPVQGTVSISSQSYFFLGELGGFYRVGKWPLGQGTGSYQSKTNTFLTLDLIGGGRLWYMDADIDFNGNGPAGISSGIAKSKSWFDFILGARAKMDIDKFFVELRGDVGGFDLGFSSDISWNLAGYIGYELPWYKITPIIGYRALYDKYHSGGGNDTFLWKGWMYGPVIGVAFQF